MATYAGSYPSKPAWQLQLDVSEGTLDAVGNRSYVSWALYIYRGDTNTPYNDSGTSYSVSGPGGFSGTFNAYRFGGVGSGTDYSGTPAGGRVLIASGAAWVGHNSDGTGSAAYSASHAASATLGTANLSGTLTLTTLTQAPGVPTAVTASYVSDTQVNVGWTNNNASNGQPTSDQIQTSVNGAAYSVVATISPATTVAITTAANQKIVAQVSETNSAGSSAYSTASPPVYTTPAAPTAVAAAKDPSLNIIVSWTPHVAFVEHDHVITHGTVTGGVTTWDGSPLATVVAGTTSYTHVTPSTSFQHVYNVHSQNTDTGALLSADVISNTVVLLVAPNAPTFPTFPAFVDKAAAWIPTWTHNPVDTTAQTAYEFNYSTNGGGTWLSTGKVTSTVSAKTFAANAYAANVALTMRVRTWGQATTGGSDGTGASPYSSLSAVTFKTRPVVTITSPANGSVYTQSQLNVVLGFSQAESATFVSATIKVYNATPTLLETLASTTLSSTMMATVVANGGSYSVVTTVIDSNGLTSDPVTSAFTVTYSPPVPAVVVATYLPNSGIVQLGLTIAAAGGGYVAATLITITRTIKGVTENVVVAYPASSPLTILDTTPTIRGTNSYKVTTISGSGATSDTLFDVVTTENAWGFLSTGAGYANIINFRALLQFAAAPSRSSTLVDASGRLRPIVLFGPSGNLVVSGSVNLHQQAAGYGSTPAEVEAFILAAGVVCYRDPSGRRMFGYLTGSVSSPNYKISSFSFQVVETS
jgi:hypothetical protein